MHGATQAAGEGGVIVARAPTRVAPVVEPGDELWTWYGNAGYMSETPEEWAAAELEFRCSYGFSPWE